MEVDRQHKIKNNSTLKLGKNNISTEEFIFTINIYIFKYIIIFIFLYIFIFIFTINNNDDNLMSILYIIYFWGEISVQTVQQDMCTDSTAGHVYRRTAGHVFFTRFRTNVNK